MFLNFLSCLATRGTTDIYELIRNNQASFTCGEREICSIIKKFQNIMNTIVVWHVLK